MQMFNSFQVLFDKALKPGGLYVIEDIQCSRLKAVSRLRHSSGLCHSKRDVFETEVSRDCPGYRSMWTATSSM